MRAHPGPRRQPAGRQLLQAGRRLPGRRHAQRCRMTGRPGRLLAAVAVDVGLLRRRREYRLLVFGQSVSDLGSMITLVAVPVQTFQITGSSVAVGLLGLAEFVPILVLA